MYNNWISLQPYVAQEYSDHQRAIKVGIFLSGWCSINGTDRKV